MVITAPAKAGSRGRLTDPPVALWAADRGLPMLRPARLRDLDSITAVAELRPDLLVLADYGQIVPAALIDLPTHGALNLHPSLLPRHRGATPIPAAILEGDQSTGVSLMRMDAGLDTGPVIAQVARPLGGNEVAPELESELADMAANLLATSIESWLGGDLSATPQDDAAATITRPLRRENGRLDPSLPVARLERQVRAYQPWPGSFVDTIDGRLVVWLARAFAGPATLAPLVRPGTIVAGLLGGAELGLVVSDGVLLLDEVKPAGGRPMSGAEYLRGRPELAGTTVLSPPTAAPGP
jgi:methionyl-tRNA formyltransferase